MAQLIGSEKARSTIIIAGGMGEKQGGASLEDKIAGLIAEGRARKAITPVVNGGNCLGIYSKPGRYDTTFIPEHKLSFPKTEGSNLAYVSQSGAFLVSRVSKLRRIEPLYGISLGNQIDLRISDYLRYLEGVSEVKVFAVYIEGFKPGDGLLTAEAAARILRDPARHVIVYKSGRTPEGRQATSGHTASVAGDYAVSRSILEAAGCIVADSIADFDDLIKSTAGLAAKSVRGNRVGLLSNAGFESVVMADSLRNGDSLVLASFADATRAALAAALSPLGIDKLQDIKNPLDVTPVADDAVFCACAGAILADPNVDCAVVSPVPMTPALKTLAPGAGYAESIYDSLSVSSRLIDLFRAARKPFAVNIDAGTLYDPMADELEAAGVPVFRRVDEAVRFLRMFVASRLRRDALSRRKGI
jgi:acyl-CoA synthetase (NDP forming)